MDIVLVKRRLLLSLEAVTVGVPHGSLPGPLLFFICINHLDDKVGIIVTNFADDTKLVV